MTQAQTVVQPPREADFDAWRLLWDGYNSFYGRKGDTALSEAVTLSTWKRLLEPSEPVHGLLATVDGQIAGIAHYIFHRNTIQIEDTCYMQDLYSAPALRGKGVARALITSVCERATATGAAGVYWHTQRTNTDAMRLYDKLARNTEFVVYRT